MARGVEEPTRTEQTGSYHEEGSYKEEHPAFGVAIVTRGSGSPRTLFQSDLQHNETISLRIETAERGRDLHRDWVHPRKNIIEVEMSLAQWGALVSSMGIGSGVPVTIRWREGKTVPGLPFQPRIAEVLGEVKGSVGKLMGQIRARYVAAREALDNKAGVKAQRDTMDSLRAAIANAESNAAFAVESVAEAAETVVAAAKSDIEAHVLNAVQLTGLTQASVNVPELTVLEDSEVLDDAEHDPDFPERSANT